METTLFILSALSILIILLILFVFRLFKQNVYFEVIKKHDNPYPFSITNEDVKDKKRVVLFGNNQYLITPNFGSDIPIKVVPSIPHVSYIECLQQSSVQPFRTRVIQFVGKIKDLEDLMLTFQNKDANGHLLQIPVCVRQHIHPNNKNIDFNDTENNQILDMEYSFPIDGNSQISFELNPNSSISINIFYNTVQYTIMSVIGYIKNLIQGNLPSQKFKVNEPIMPQIIN